jgi:hypothetical protein
MEWIRGGDAAAIRDEDGLSQKIQKSSKSLLTLRRAADYIRLTNEGGAPLATKKFASKSALCEIQESRVSDTRQARSQKRNGPRHRVCGVCSLKTED